MAKYYIASCVFTAKFPELSSRTAMAFRLQYRTAGAPATGKRSRMLYAACLEK